MRFIQSSVLFLALCLAGFNIGFAQVQVSLPDTTGTAPDTMTVPIHASDLTGQGVYSAEFDVDYNPDVVEAIGIKRAGTRADTVQPTVHLSTGRVSLAFATTAPMEGSGDFAAIKFRLRGDAEPDSTMLTFSQALLNEGTPSVNTSSGKIKLRAIHVNPSQSTIYEGDSLQFQVTGTVTPPVSWSLTNSGVADISSTGKFYALQRGFTKVIAEDQTGLKDTTGNIVIESVQLRDLTLTIPDTAYTQQLSFMLPVYISDVSALDIHSGEFTFHYNQHDLEVLDVISQGTISDIWGAPTYQIDNGQIRIASAGTNTLSGSGILYYIRFRVKPDAGGSSTFDITDALFNEDIYANIVTGNFQVLQAPDITISPQDVEMTNGEVVQFSASGGTPPYTWETDDPGTASIDNAGLLTTHQSGAIQVKVEDSEGFRDSTASLIINDFKVTAPDTSMFLSSGAFSFPLFVDRAVSSFGIYSFEFTMHSSDTSIVRLDTIETSGTLADQWGSIVSKDTVDYLDVAASGTSALSGSAPLLNVILELGSEVSAGDQVSLTFSKMMMNEGEPSVTVIEGSVTLEIRSVDVFLPDTSASRGQSIAVPVAIPGNTTNLDITSYEFDVAYDSTLLTATGTNGAGTLSSGFNITHNAVPGTLSVSGADATPLSGSGDLVLLEFDVVSDSAGTSPLDFAGFQFNDGIPVAVTNSGSLHVANAEPFAVNDTTSTSEDSSTVLHLLTNDSDPDGDSLTIDSLMTAELAGEAVIDPGDTTVTYTVPSGVSGTEIFGYYISDPFGGTDMAEVYVTVQSTNTAPVAQNDTISLPEDSTGTFHLLGNDFDTGGDAISIIGIDTAATAGNVTIDPGDTTITYVPLPDSNGVDSLFYTIEDTEGLTDSAMVYIQLQPVNDAPLAFDLLAPDDSTEVIINNDNLTDSLLFEWQASADIDSDSLTYGLGVQTGNLTIIAFADTAVTTVNLAYQWIADAMEAAGVEQISGNWTILVTDGQDTTLATNGPRYLMVDATTVGVEDEDGLPNQFALEQNYPNPFNPVTTVEYALPKRTTVDITVYDILGNKVRTLVSGTKKAGHHSIQWHGRNDHGQQVSTGVYWYRMQTPEYQTVRKMVYMK